MSTIITNVVLNDVLLQEVQKVVASAKVEDLFIQNTVIRLEDVLMQILRINYPVFLFIFYFTDKNFEQINIDNTLIG